MTLSQWLYIWMEARMADTDGSSAVEDTGGI